MNPPPQLFLCGLGPYPRRTATVAVLHALGRCDVVFAAGGPQAEDIVAEFCPGAALKRYAGDGAVLKELERGRAVGLACAGHPFVLGGLAAGLLRRCRRQGVPVTTFGTVSALDVAIAELGKSLGLDIRAVAVYEAARLPSKPALCPGQWLVAAFPKGGATSSLRRLYPPGHSVWLLGDDEPPLRCTLEGAEAILMKTKTPRILVAEARP